MKGRISKTFEMEQNNSRKKKFSRPFEDSCRVESKWNTQTIENNIFPVFVFWIKVGGFKESNVFILLRRIKSERLFFSEE